MRVLLALPLLFLLQGFLTALLEPLPSPDLFLVAALLPLGRLRVPQLVAAAYLIGLVQDVSGYGSLGVHALGLAGGALLAAVVTAPAALPTTPVLTRLSAILAALAGKWVVLLAALVWLGQSAPLAEVARVAPTEALLTLLVGIWFPFGARMQQVRAPRTHYL